MWASGHNDDIERAAYGYEQTREVAMAVFAKNLAKGRRRRGNQVPPNGAGPGSQVRRTLRTVQLISFSYGQLSPGFQPGLFHGPQGRTGPLLKSSDLSLGRLALAAGGLALSAVLALSASVGPAPADGGQPHPPSVVEAAVARGRLAPLGASA